MSTSNDTLVLNQDVLKDLRSDYNYNEDLGKADNPQLTWQPVDPDTPNVDLSGFATPFKVFSIAFTVIFVLAMFGYILYKRYASLEEKVEVDLTDEDTIYGIDFANTLEAMEKKGDYFQCIRLRYLQLLRRLHDDRKIFWLPSKTPTQYVFEMNDDNFRKLTNIFLKVRYGNYPADAELYGEVKSLCTSIESKEGGDK